MTTAINPVPALEDVLLRDHRSSSYRYTAPAGRDDPSTARGAGGPSLQASLLGGSPRKPSGSGTTPMHQSDVTSPTTSSASSVRSLEASSSRGSINLHDLGVNDEDEQWVRERELPMMYCFIACAFGLIGFGLTLDSANEDLCPVNYPNELTSKSLTRWPSTVSELNSDWSTGRGRLFFSFMLVTSVMLLAAKVPYTLEGHDVSNQHNVNVGHVCCFGFWMKTGTFKLGRVFAVPIGLMFVALCPTQNYWSNHQPGEAVVKSVHLASAALLFGVGSLIEIHRAAHLLIFDHRTAANRLWQQAHCCSVFSRCCRIYWRTLKHDRRGARAIIASVLCIGLLTIIPSFIKTHNGEIMMIATKGEVMFSPTGTDYCPGPVYQYAAIGNTTSSMREAVFDQLTCQKTCAEEQKGDPVYGQLRCHETHEACATRRSFTSANNRSAGSFIPSRYMSGGFLHVHASGDKDKILISETFLQNAPNLSCTRTRVLPQSIALCVCAEPDLAAKSAPGKRVCKWTNPGSAEGRIRLFIQEVFLAIALLANFAIIAFEFNEATPRKPAPQGQPSGFCCCFNCGQSSLFCCGRQAIAEKARCVWQKVMRYGLPALMVLIMIPVLPVCIWTGCSVDSFPQNQNSFNIKISASLPLALICLIFLFEPRLRRMCIILAYTVALFAAIHWYLSMTNDMNEGAWYSWILALKDRPVDGTIWLMFTTAYVPAYIACCQICRHSVDNDSTVMTHDQRHTWGQVRSDRGQGNVHSIYD